MLLVFISQLTRFPNKNRFSQKQKMMIFFYVGWDREKERRKEREKGGGCGGKAKRGKFANRIH